MQSLSTLKFAETIRLHLYLYNAIDEHRNSLKLVKQIFSLTEKKNKARLFCTLAFFNLLLIYQFKKMVVYRIYFKRKFLKYLNIFKEFFNKIKSLLSLSFVSLTFCF